MDYRFWPEADLAPIPLAGQLPERITTPIEVNDALEIAEQTEA
jgi:hypothetical protein